MYNHWLLLNLLKGVLPMNYTEATYEELNDEIEKLLDINPTTLDAEAIRNQKIFTELNRMYVQTSRKLMKLTNQKNEVELHRYRHFNGKMTSAHYKEYPLDVAIVKTDIPKYLDSDPVVVEIRGLLKEQEMIVKLVEEAKASLKSRGFDLKNAIEYQKLMSGN